jgi:hypothetical protein
VVSLSCPIGVEALPRREAEPLVAAYERGAAPLPTCFEAWGARSTRPGPDDIDRVLDAGFIGVSLPAGAYAVQEGGVLERHSVSYTEELYPL